MSANIIKGIGGTTVTGIKKEVYDASLEARKIIESARSEASSIIAQAKVDQQSLTGGAKERGYAAGLAQWNETLVEAWKRRDEYLDQNESELVRLAMAAAKKIIGEEVRSNPNAIRHTVREALRSVGRQKSLNIQVNPSQATIISEQMESLRALLGGARDLTVSGNASIEDGGCIVESDIGIIDARISTQLAALEQALVRRVSQ